MASNSAPLPLDATFDKDDLHFRTVTSLLNLFNRPDRKHYECTVSKDARRNFKRMLGLTMLLARGTEVVACMPKRSVDGITLFCVPDKKHTKLRDYTRHDLLVAKNPPPSISGSPISTLRFSQIDSPQFVSTVNYLLQKWGQDQTFEEHVQLIAYLVATTAANAASDVVSNTMSSEVACKYLAQYATFQGIRKLERRLRSKKMPRNHLQLLQRVDFKDLGNPPLHRLFEMFNEVEISTIKKVIETLCIDSSSYPTLSTVINGGSIADDTGKTLLREYFDLVLRILGELDDHLGVLQRDYQKFSRPAQPDTSSQLKQTKVDTWRAKVPSEDELRVHLNCVTSRLRFIMYFAWNSCLFKWMVTTYLPLSLLQHSDTDEVMEDDKDMAPEDGGEAAEDEGMEPSEFPEVYANQDQESSAGHQRFLMQFIYWLRLVSAPIYFVYSLYADQGTKIARITFHVLVYPPTSTQLRPWEEVIRDLYPDTEDACHVIEGLREEYGHLPKANIISDPMFQFRGVAHCEAILSTLHYLVNYKSFEAAMIPKTLLEYFKFASPLVAASKRACPACAAIQYELSCATGRPSTYPIYAKHTRVYGCALPVGLPAPIRKRVIAHFETLLRDYLDGIKARSWSQTSSECAPYSSVQNSEDRIQSFFMCFDD